MLNESDSHVPASNVVDNALLEVYVTDAWAACPRCMGGMLTIHDAYVRSAIQSSQALLKQQTRDSVNFL